MGWTEILGMAASGPLGMVVGTATRLVTSWVQIKQEKMKADERREERAHDLAMRRIDMEAATQASAQQLAAINAQGDIDTTVAAYKTMAPTGIRWVDGWNGAMRPGSFTLLWGVWIWLHYATHGTPQFGGLITADVSMLLAAMGFLWADRTLRKNLGK